MTHHTRLQADNGRQRTIKEGAASNLFFIEPMMALRAGDLPVGNWIYELKFDGYRALVFKADKDVRLVSRNRTNFNNDYPELVDSLRLLTANQVTIDGEITALDENGKSSFQLLQSYGIDKQIPLIYQAFDLLFLDGTDVRSRPLIERRKLLVKLLKKAPDNIRFSEELRGEREELLQVARQFRLEGLMAKRPDSRYESGRRSGAWIKVKLTQQQEFIIGGYTPPEGSRKYFGSLLVGYHGPVGLLFAGRVGTGFSEKLLLSIYDILQKIRRPACPFANLPEKRRGRWGQGITPAIMKRCHWVEPVLVAQVKFTEWTSDDQLRQPVFLGLRTDKQATGVGVITLDGYAASHRAVDKLKTSGILPRRVQVRSCKYLNNVIEQDHRRIKQRVRPMLGFKRFETAAVMIAVLS
jgi:bifunctional non-homologous end joining protein LigD